VRRIWRRARLWNEWRGAFDPGAQEIVRAAERVVKGALRAVAAAAGSPIRADRVREILERALRDLEDLGGRD
jgi:hypothetical protein